MDNDGLTGTDTEISMQLDIIHDFVLGVDTDLLPNESANLG